MFSPSKATGNHIVFKESSRAPESPGLRPAIFCYLEKDKLYLFMTALSACMACVLLAPSALAYPEFQEFSEKNSGRNTNCATCHESSTGPAGSGPGQIGSLTKEDFAKLTEARMAFEPGKEVDSPILNRFGDLIIKKLGKKKVLEDRKEPAKLATDYGFESDIDNDGIADAQEYLDGTDPQNAHHGDAWRLFVVNISRYAPHIIACAIGVFLLDWGFARMIGGFMVIKKARKAGKV